MKDRSDDPSHHERTLLPRKRVQDAGGLVIGDGRRIEGAECEVTEGGEV